MPGAKVRFRSMTARSSVMPCDLWIVIAHAQRSGTWLTDASTVSPSIISHAACFMVTMLPFSNSTMGQPPLASGAKPRTVPIDPLTYWRSVSLRSAMTAAPSLSTSLSGASMFFFSRSTRFAGPACSAKKVCSSLAICASRRSLSPSACRLTGNRCTATSPGAGARPRRAASTSWSSADTQPSRMSVSTVSSWPSSWRCCSVR